YRWRMRLECSNRDWKTGVLLREGDDHHAPTHPLPLHHLLLALPAAQWGCALVGLQAWHDRPTAPPAPTAPAPTLLDTLPPGAVPPPAVLEQGPAIPPPVL